MHIHYKKCVVFFQKNVMKFLLLVFCNILECCFHFLNLHDGTTKKFCPVKMETEKKCNDR